MSKFRLFGGGSAQKTLERCRGWAGAVNLAEDGVRALSDAGLRETITRLKQRHRDGEALDDLLPETFAIVREAAVRTLGERPYDEQVIGGAALHLGSVVEMKTGEGKTLTATLPGCLHALTGQGVHILTANDYLAARDAEWMGPVYRFLGLTCAFLPRDGSRAERRPIYGADVVYGAASGFAYDYLRDNLVIAHSDVIQRSLFSAIVDEADLVMVDEAGLLPEISRDSESTSDHARLATLAARLEPGVHYDVDKARRIVSPTERGMALIEDWLGAEVYSGDDVGLAHRVELALRAKELYAKDRDYVIVDGALRVIDASTQRVTDRFIGGGLDQALDAKEGLDVRPERRTLAVIDVHAYLGLYTRLAGMTGVVEGEIDAYRDFYDLGCVAVPPHRPVRRVDHDPVLYVNDDVMLRVMVRTVDEKRAAGRPSLIGTASAETTEQISQALLAKGIGHDVLTAKNHALEAEIIARAGRPGAVTVLTRMAGRGVDIRLTEPEGAGLFVLGIGPLPSRRLELHLRGRAGRGGDTGESAFFFSMDDPGVKVPKFVDRLNETSKDEDPMAGKVIARALKGVLNAISAAETQRSASVLRYSAVREEQRAAVYAKRDDVLSNGVSPDETNRLVEQVMWGYVLAARTGSEDVDKLGTAIRTLYPATLGRDTFAAGLSGGPSSKARTELADVVVRDALAASAARESDLGPDVAAELKRRIMLVAIDRSWQTQLQDLNDAHDGVSLRTMAGGDPFTEYRRAASRLVEKMWGQIAEDFVGYWFNVEVSVEPLDDTDA
ncbi:MAG: hypothetical protein AUG49_19530 [Catenulispora sp. 13_1_20CM_3_70_7]|nr:MAG: hypothetical protein AUG49_19530 [Catenulispora sp. 13_1_20CM_3_70_7]